MAYNFAGGNYVRFSPAPFTGYSFGAVTVACYFRRSSMDGTTDIMVNMTDSAINGWRTSLKHDSGGAGPFFISVNVTDSAALSGVISSTSVWYLGAVTWVGTAGTKPRLHLHNGTSWAHADGATNLSPFGTVAGTDLFSVSPTFGGGQAFNGDVVCAGIKKANATDGQIETLTRTHFQTWRDFGFDWLIGFDSSLEAAGILQDQASPGTGDETAISGTSAVADPAGWNWTGAAAPAFTPQIMVVT